MDFEFEDKPESKDRRIQMGQEQPRMSNLVDTTDCLEAVSAIKFWKNLLFLIILLGLLLVQGSFWVMNLHLVKGDGVVLGPPVGGSAAGSPIVADKIKEAAKQIASDTNAAAEPNMQQSLQVGAEPNKPAPVELTISLRLKAKHIAAIVRFLDFILIPCSMLYCLTILFALKVSLIGRLGGINHIARAFFLSLVSLVLLLPWQLLFAPVFAGAMFTPSEMIAACQAQKTDLAYVSMILRFSVYWLLVVLLLLAAQMRSMRWAKATLRRLDVM
ncbi:MAG: hypothetical protein ABR913_03985 [Sedimentisphaerales bacterium]|jgi:hypothetical protein